jgi:hypothetical protein
MPHAGTGFGILEVLKAVLKPQPRVFVALLRGPRARWQRRQGLLS